MGTEYLTTRQWSPGSGDSGGMPSLWVFLVIVLGILLALVIGTSAVMHLIQARQRRSLARRIANGEVDLEILGLKRLNVPREQVDKMPQYTYTASREGDLKEPEAVAMAVTRPEVRRSAMYSQSSCSICLDDFVDKETMIRELPCNHIFHPECIDPFLMNNSSLCPLCKKSALPAGYCPVTVTNVMVRRERLGRTGRPSRRRAMGNNPHFGRPSIRGQISQVTPAPIPQTNSVATPAQDTELGVIESHQPDAAEPPPEIALQGPEARRAWRRERLAQQHAREFDQQGEVARQAEAKRPFWRRWLGLT